MAIWYASLQDVMMTADVADSAHMTRLVARQCDAAADAVLALTKRVFYPTVATRVLPWPQDQFGPSRRLYLGFNELAAPPTLVVTGLGDAATTIPTQYVAGEPAAEGPPYSVLTLDDNAPAVFQQGSNQDASIAVTGTFGYRLNEDRVASTASALSGTSVTVTSSADIGVGTLLRVGLERLVVTGRGWSDTGNIEPVTLAAASNADSFQVTPGVVFAEGEEIMLDAERMLVLAQAGTLLVVQRAFNGSALAAHSGVTSIYAPRQLTVQRAALGTTQTDTATGGDAVWKFRFPGLIVQLFIAEAVVGLAQSRAAFARVSGSGENAVESIGKGIADVRKQVLLGFRRVRLEAV